METIAIGKLKAHPAQMRTTYDVDALAALTLQVYERGGLNTWQPIVAAANGEGYHIISGHRRQMAQLLAFALTGWATEHPQTEITIEVVRTMLTTLIESLGSLPQVITSLLEKFGAQEVSFVPFAGSQKAEILTLHAANYGTEKPDMLGVAHSFRQAVMAGATPEEIARNSGHHVRFVQNHLALTEIPPDLAQRIAAGELPLSVAAAVADLPDPKRTGLAIFILANEPGKLTAKSIKNCAAALKKWPGLQPPLMVKHQSQRNIARTLVRLWGQVVETYPEDAYAAAAMLIYRDVHSDPWSSQEKLTVWFQALGGETYFTDGRINWKAVITYLLPEVTCTNCPLTQLPQPPLRSDISQGQGGVLGMPCRTGQTAEHCLHGLTPTDPFDVRVPWSWSGHSGVEYEEGEYRVKSYDALHTAWQAQAEKERAEDEEAVGGQQPDGSQPDGSQPDKSQETGGPELDGSQGTSESVTDSPIVKQRAQIADFMKRHETLAAAHPFATPCGRCRHRLERSPTKDAAVPPCAWAGRSRRVQFRVLASEDSQAPRVPVCRQFAPDQPWSELIPAHPQPPEIPREWLKTHILQLAQDANRHGSQRNAFEFLTGRPMGANESYGDWFQEQLDTQIGDLSLAQLFTLFVWAHAEWQRARGTSFLLPVNGAQFVRYQERRWPKSEATS